MILGLSGSFLFSDCEKSQVLFYGVSGHRVYPIFLRNRTNQMNPNRPLANSVKSNKQDEKHRFTYTKSRSQEASDPADPFLTEKGSFVLQRFISAEKGYKGSFVLKKVLCVTRVRLC